MRAALRMAGAPQLARTRAPGSHHKQSHLGSHPTANRRRESPPPPPGSPPGPFPTKTNPATPIQNKTYPGKSHGPGDALAAHPPASELSHCAPRAGAPKRGRGVRCSETPGRKCQKSHQFLVAPVVLVAFPIQPLRQQLQRHETHTDDHRAGAGWWAAG